MAELALVTGGETGIGAAIAERLRARGCEVRTPSRRSGFDLTDASVIGRLIDELPRLDVLVNNAGVAESAPLRRTDDAFWQRHFDINVTAPFRLCRAALPLLQAAPDGCIVNIASTAALHGAPYIAAYAASKHALLGLSRVLAQELKGVRVNTVCPGFVDSPLTDRSIETITQLTGKDAAEARAALAEQNPSARLITPDEVAARVIELIEGDTTGSEVVIA
jgi:NAD(P)-dependent dehydrogenase (short-subunit alcohol dehydrogenase family)